MEGAAQAAPSDPESVALRRQALALTYNLDREQAVALLTQAIASHPDDPANHLALASVVWSQLLFRRGSITIDEYLGPPSNSDLARTPPPADVTSVFRTSVAKALELAERRLKTHPNDPEALFHAGLAVGREAAFVATEEGKVGGAFRAAKRAYDTHERVLELDPSRKEAGLIVGTYRYIVATLGLFKRWLAYMVGFGGDRAVAMRLLEECAAHPSDLQAEAQFALLVTYSRENRHDDVLRVLKGLREQFPRNRLLWIETGATLIRANRPAEALPWLNDGWAMLARDTRPRAFGEEATWRYKRGLAFAMLGRGAEARAEADAGAALQASRWVKGRLAAVSGRVEDLAGNRAAALQAYRRAVELCKAGNDPLGVEDAERWIDKPFRGTSVAPGRQYQ